MNPFRLVRITIDDAQCGGRPCIRRLRIRVTDIPGLPGAGANFEEILQDYPYLEREDILAAIEYAVRVRLPVNNQLPPELACVIRDNFGTEALHASARGFIVVSKNEDFVKPARSRPPQSRWV